MFSEDATDGFDFKLNAFVSGESKIPDDKAYVRARETMSQYKMISDTMSGMGTPSNTGSLSATPAT